MVRILKSDLYVENLRYIEAAGLSGDTKPTAGIITGSRFTEVDTGLEFLFDEEDSTWYQFPPAAESTGD